MFNGLAIKILMRENARLRRELRRKEQTISELLDSFVFHRNPERFIQQSAKAGGDGRPATAVSDLPSDAYSAAIVAAERAVDEQLASRTVNDYEPYEDADI